MSEITLSDTLNNAYKKDPIEKSCLDKMKIELSMLISGINDKPNESEEHHKKRFSDFLSKTWYEPYYYINTSGNIDLVIHNGNKASSPIGVIIETKKPGKNPDMVSKKNFNVKSLQQLLLYFFRETINNKNIQIKHLIVTNAVEWFIFDSKEFYQLFLKNNDLVQLYKEYSIEGLFANDTNYFYTNIAKPAIDKVKDRLNYTYINLNDFENSDEKNLVFLYKILSPQHLLKKPFSNDNNSLNKNFYYELLYILGLSEESVEGKKVINRNPKEKRQNASLLESAIYQLSDDISNEAEQYHIALELVITWINRILFLKLLEAQLLNYQNNNKDYAFLNIDAINDYNELNTLFFKVLAKEPKDREETIRVKYKKVPYLNSSLFDKTSTENYCTISTLKNNQIDYFPSTILKDEKGNIRKGKINSLEYIFSFLDAYDFSNEGKELVKDKKKSIINASVLGLIFEKINGYKDGSYFTPGFITSFICSQTIQSSVVSKFNSVKGWTAKNITDIYNKIDTIEIHEANEIINSIKIVDPAVGSGHFLVSSLNEIIALKSQLGILADKNGKKIKDYVISVFNDELDISDSEDGKPFEYNSKIAEKQRIQETLFNEKRKIIENCLFGVDLNSNSVKICRLRLWIELLKNAYYTQESNYTELETLPNLELNVKCGNSLISRFDLDIDISETIKNLDFTIEDYKTSVRNYKNSTSKAVKDDLTDKIEKIKNSFSTEIKNLNKYAVRKRNVHGELVMLISQGEFFEDEKSKAVKEKRIAVLQSELEKIEAKMDFIEKNKIYNSAFEWRFEFPELLDNDGNFIGFDIVIGNPPYIRVQDLEYHFIDYCKENYDVAYKRVDISILFFELANKLLNNNGVNSYISSNQFLSTEYGRNARKYLLEKCNIQKIINFGDLPVFQEALTYVSIFILEKGKSNNFLYSKVEILNDCIEENYVIINIDLLDDNVWSLSSSEHSLLINNIKRKYPTLSTKAKCWAGLFTGKDDILQFDKDEIDTIPFEKEILLPVLRAQDCIKYKYSEPSKYVIYPYKEEENKTVILSENELKIKYPKAYSYLISNKNKLLDRKDSRKKVSDKKSWFGLIRFGKYSIFKQEKIISPGEVKNNKFSLDTSGSGFSCARVFAITTIDKSFDINLLLGILNSKFIEYYLHSVAPVKAGGYFQYSAEFIDSVPLPIECKENKNDLKQITKIVQKILKQNKEEIILQLQNNIDQLIYKVYGLTNDEVILIENSII